jgi:hypothetical protein
VKEFVSCFRSENRLYGDEGFEALFEHLDTNADGIMSISEYNKAQEILFKPKNIGTTNEETVTFTDRNGKTREISLRAVYKTMEDNMKGIKRTEDNKLVKEEEKTLKVSELSKSDPQVDSMVKLGNWSFFHLQELKIIHAGGKLKSVLSEEMKHRTKSFGEQLLEFPSYSSQHSALVNMTLRVTDTDHVEYKVLILYDPIALEAPYLHLLRITKVMGNKEQSIDPPAPMLRNWSFVRYSFFKQLFERLISNPVHLAVLVIFWLLAGAVACLVCCQTSQEFIDENEESLSKKKYD